MQRGSVNAYVIENQTTGASVLLTAANWKYKIQAARAIGGVPW
jgi:hypothetical protein